MLVPHTDADENTHATYHMPMATYRCPRPGLQTRCLIPRPNSNTVSDSSPKSSKTLAKVAASQCVVLATCASGQILAVPRIYSTLQSCRGATAVLPMCRLFRAAAVLLAAAPTALRRTHKLLARPHALRPLFPQLVRDGHQSTVDCAAAAHEDVRTRCLDAVGAK